MVSLMITDLLYFVSNAISGYRIFVEMGNTVNYHWHYNRPVHFAFEYSVECKSVANLASQ
jgi:hypothetical protein